MQICCWHAITFIGRTLNQVDNILIDFKKCFDFSNDL